jgi:hypothetical protein
LLPSAQAPSEDPTVHQPATEGPFVHPDVSALLPLLQIGTEERSDKAATIGGSYFMMVSPR